MRTVDAHVHLFARAGGPFQRSISPTFPAEREALVEPFLALMDSYAVDHAVAVPICERDGYVADCLTRHHDRLVGIAVDRVAADGVDDPPASRLGAVVPAGFRGLRVHQIAEDSCGDPRATRRFEIFRLMARRGLVLWFYSTPRQLELLEVLARELPSLPVVLNHLGFCPTEMTLSEGGLPRAAVELPPPTLPVVLRMARLPNVNVMMSGEYAFSAEPFPFRDVTPIVRAIFDAYGPDRMMWASDYPLIAEQPGYGAVHELPQLHLGETSGLDLAKIMGGTAHRVLGIGEAAG